MGSAVRKAVIPAAGLGTRFLPATKSQPKEMLPVVDKPSIQYVVEEAVRAGLTDILVITGRGKRAIEDHFDRNFELEFYLEQKGARAAQGGPGDLRARRHPLHPPARPARPRPRRLGGPRARGQRAVRRAPRRRHHGRRVPAAASHARRPRALRPVRGRAEARRGGDLVVRLRRARGGGGEPRARPVDRGEAEAGGRAVEPRGDRALRVHAADLRRARPDRRPARAASCSSPTRSGSSRRKPVFGYSFETGATTSVRRSTSCGPTSSSRSTGPISAPSWSRSSSTSCAAAAFSDTSLNRPVTPPPRARAFWGAPAG